MRSLLLCALLQRMHPQRTSSLVSTVSWMSVFALAVTAFQTLDLRIVW